MEKIKKTLSITLFWAILLSILFVVGIPMIVVFAGKNWFLMALGIVFVVFGFYGMPMVWVYYGTLRANKRALELVLNENIYSVQELSEQLGVRPSDMLATVRKLINKGYLTGYLLIDNNFLKLNEKVKQEKSKIVGVCASCGAKSVIEGNAFVCPYCGGLVRDMSNKE